MAADSEHCFPFATIEALIASRQISDAASLLKAHGHTLPEPAHRYLNARIAAAENRLDEALALAGNTGDSGYLDSFPFLVLRAELLESSGREEIAADTWLKAARTGDMPRQCLVNAGRLLLRLGKTEPARQGLAEAITFPPNEPVAWFYYGVSLEHHDNRSAYDAFTKAMQLDPAYGEAYYRYALLRLTCGEHAEALEPAQMAAQLLPDYPAAHNCLGRIQLALGEPLPALASLLRAHELAPSEKGFADDAATGCVQAGRALLIAAEYAQAEDLFSRAAALDPSYPIPHINLGIELLRRGDWEHGWAEYYWRHQIAQTTWHPAPPEWQGEPLDGKRLLVLTEQGHGDTIQFARYLAPTKACGASVLLLCTRPVTRLLATLPWVDDIFSGESWENDFKTADYWVRLMDLPLRLGLEPRTMSVPPYFTLPKTQPVIPRDKPRVGVAWRGNPKHSNDADRSVPSQLANFFTTLDGVECVSLTPLAAHTDPDPLPSPLLGTADFFDTRDLLASLDWVITVDTSLVHLAGAAGVPTWLLLPPLPDWRWGIEGETTPWYDRVRILRRQRGEGWASFLHRVSGQIKNSPVF